MFGQWQTANKNWKPIRLERVDHGLGSFKKNNQYWSNGVMEYWSNDIKMTLSQKGHKYFPTLQYSITPMLQDKFIAALKFKKSQIII
jgi:hypothetical protein